MFCGKCGAMLSEKEKFCPKCGTPVVINTAENSVVIVDNNEQKKQNGFTTKNKKAVRTKKEKPSMSKKKKAKIIVVSILVLILVLVISAGAMFLTSSAFATYRNMNSQNYEEAVKEYQLGVENSFIQRFIFNIEMKEYAQKIFDDYSNQSIDFESANNALKALEKMGDKNAGELLDKVAVIYAERNAIENGNKYYNEKDYINAVKEYSKINPQSENYKNISVNLSDALVQYKKYVASEVDKLAKSLDYEKIIPILDEAKKFIPDDEQIKKSYQDYTALFEEKCISDSKNLYDKKDYDRAISTLEHGLKVLPNSTIISEELERQVGSKPIKLVETDVLYDGVCYSLFKSNEGESFQIGSKTYYEGFEIWDDHSLFGDGDGYALFDLQGEYSEISFDVGRTNEYEMQDVVLKIYLNDKFLEEYSLSAQSSLKNITINLAYAKNMKLEITGGSRVKYEFVNVYLKK